MSDDQPRQAAASSDSDYSLTIEEAGNLYAAADLPRDLRTIQRYCAKGRLECRLVEIPFGEKYFITPTSVQRHISYLKEVRQAMASRDEPRPVADELPGPKSDDTAPTSHGEPRPAATISNEETARSGERQAPTSRDEPRPVATENHMATRYVAGLERENDFLRGQIAVKDSQIGALLERDRETNFLIRGLQTMLSPLLGGGAPVTPERGQVFNEPENGNG